MAFRDYAYVLIVHAWDDQLLPQLLEQFDTLPSQYRHVEHMPEDIWLKTISDIMRAMRTEEIFPNMAFVYAKIVPS